MFQLRDFVAAAVIGLGITTGHATFAADLGDTAQTAALKATVDDGNPGLGFRSE